MKHKPEENCDEQEILNKKATGFLDAIILFVLVTFFVLVGTLSVKSDTLVQNKEYKIAPPPQAGMTLTTRFLCKELSGLHTVEDGWEKYAPIISMGMVIHDCMLAPFQVPMYEVEVLVLHVKEDGTIQGFVSFTNNPDAEPKLIFYTAVKEELLVKKDNLGDTY